MALICLGSLMAALPRRTGEPGVGLAHHGDRRCNFRLGNRTVEITRSQIILIMGLMAFAMRALPQLFFAGAEISRSIGSLVALCFLRPDLQHYLGHLVHVRRPPGNRRNAAARAGFDRRRHYRTQNEERGDGHDRRRIAGTGARVVAVDTLPPPQRLPGGETVIIRLLKAPADLLTEATARC